MSNRIEPAMPGDFAAIAALNVEAYREFAAHVTRAGWAAMRANLRRVAPAAGRATFLVVRHAGGLAGSVAYCAPGHSRDPIPGAWASILLLAVAPPQRGRGIGTDLVQHCVARARRDGAATVGLFTSELMTAARRIYEAAGFRLDGEIEPRHGLRYWRYRLDVADQGPQVPTPRRG